MSRASAREIDSVVFVNPGSASVRRADSDFKRDRYRLYELAGAPHAAWLDGCEGPDSSFPTSAFVRAALRLLFQWAEDALPPPRAPQDQRAEPTGRFRWRASTDTETRSAACAHPTSTCRLARYEAHSRARDRCVNSWVRETLLPTEALVARYRDANRYLTEFTAALDATIRARYLLAADREPILRDDGRPGAGGVRNR